MTEEPVKRPRGRPKGSKQWGALGPPPQVLEKREAARRDAEAAAIIEAAIVSKGLTAVIEPELDAIAQERGDARPKFRPRPAKRYGNHGSSLYEARFCGEVIEYMSQGHTLSAFCGAIGVTKQTLTGWGRQNADFTASVQIAKLKCQEFWERELIEVAKKGTHTSGRVTAIQFALKNLAKEDWTDKQVLEVQGGFGVHHTSEPTDYSRLSANELLQLEALHQKLSAPAEDE